MFTTSDLKVKGQEVFLQGTRVNSEWFFYWKISSQLWSNKMRDFAEKGVVRLIIPIYWAFHYIEESKEIDFGQNNPQTDFSVLSCCAQKNKLDLIFLFPLTPSPLWPNGGIPSVLATSCSIHEYGLSLKIPYLENYHQMYSFYAPNVFNSLRKFAWNLKEYFDHMKLSYPIMGIQSGYLEQQSFISFLKDYSPSFDVSFGKYLQTVPMKEGMSEDKKEEYLSDFEESVEGLYTHMLNKTLKDYYVGNIQQCFFFSHPMQVLLPRINLHQLRPSYQIFNQISICIQNGFVPFLSLVEFSPETQEDISMNEYSLLKFLSSLEDVPYPLEYFSTSIQERKNEELFLSICIFGEIENWKQLGVFSLDKRGMKNTVYHQKDIGKIDFPEQILFDKIYLIQGSEITEGSLKKILHGFLLGHKEISSLIFIILEVVLTSINPIIYYLNFAFFVFLVYWWVNQRLHQNSFSC